MNTLNTLKIEPADMTLNYNCGDITRASKIIFNDSHVGYVGYCENTDEWLTFDVLGLDDALCSDTRNGAIESLIDTNWESCKLVD